jgi:hypothetical protein
VFGGSVDPAALGAPLRSVDIDLTDSPIPVGAHVDVRSRFHDHWIHGFAVAEYVDGHTRHGYRLRRITDTEPLPLLFDAADVRSAIVPSDQNALVPAEEPERTMWR